MSDMKLGLSVTATGKQAQRELRRTAKSTDDLGGSVKQVGTAAAGAGAKVKKAAREQSEAIRQAARQTTDSLGEVKRGGVEAGQSIRHGMREGVRAEREAARETERLGSAWTRMIRRIGGSGGAFRRMARGIRNEVKSIKRSLDTTRGKLAGLGVGFVVGQQVVHSASLDRELIRTQQTAGMSDDQRKELRNELFGMGRKNGNSPDALLRGFNTLVASGLNYQAAMAGTHAIDRAMTVTGADPEILAKALVAGGSAFDFDLAKPGRAVDLLDKMIVAGRLGNAELENLASIFPKIGSRASQIGMPFAQTLAFAEALSTSELDPSRLGTLAESTLRLFGNRQYAMRVHKETGVDFFDKQGKRRNVADVFGDLRKQYTQLTTDNARSAWLGKVLKGTDLDTQRGFGIMLSGNKLDNFISTNRDIQNASGVMEHDIADNRNTSTATAGRLKATFGQAMDEMSRPLNKAFAEAGSYMVENYSGKEMLAAGVAAGVAAPLLGRLGKGVLGKMLGGAAGLASTMRGVAVGHVLNEATGTTPVFVTNWAGAAGALGGRGLLGGPVGGGEKKEGLRDAAKKTGTAAREFLTTYGWALKAVGAIGTTLLVSGSTSKVNKDAERLKLLAMAGDRGAAEKLMAWRTSGPFGRDLTDQEREAETQKLLGTPTRQARTRKLLSTDPEYAADLARLQYQPRTASAAPFVPPSIGDAVRWVSDVASRLENTEARLDVEQAHQTTAALDAVRKALEALLGRPLRIEVTTDNPALHAQLVDEAEREARRG